MRRGLALTVGIFLTALAVTGCSGHSTPNTSTPSMNGTPVATADEAKTQIMDLYQATIALVRTDGWDVQGSWDDCTADEQVTAPSARMRSPMSEAVRRLLVFGVAMVVVCMGVTGCSASPAPIPTGAKGTVMTPAEAKEQVMGLYHASMRVISAEGWEEDGSWTDCDTSGSQELVQWNFIAGFKGTSPDTPQILIAKVEKIWNEQGLGVQIQIDSNLSPTRYIVSDPSYMSGSNPDGSLYQFYIGAGLADFRATSACVPGNIGKLNS